MYSLNHLHIKLDFLGLDREGGHLRLDGLISELQAIKESLVRMDKMIDGEPSSYFRVVEALHLSESEHFQVVLAPTPIPNGKRPVNAGRVEAFHHRYFEELGKIERGAAPSSDVDDKTLLALEKVAKGEGETYKALTIRNEVSRVSINEAFKCSVKRLLKDQMVAYGTITGRLDALNLHGENAGKIWIYPSTGPTRILCAVKRDHWETIQANTKKVVEVEGKKFYRPKSYHPHRITVEEIREVHDAEHLNSVRGLLKDSTDPRDSVELIKAARDAWE